MRSLFASLTLALLVGCSAKQSQSDWEYSPAHGAYEARLLYRFGDGEGTTLIGSCDPEPGFMLAGGDWDGPQFKLTVDGKSWMLPILQSEHGHYLAADKFSASDAPQLAIAHAKQSIAFQVGKWRREIKPDSALKRFVADCG